jgi:hypothetical protein
MDAVGDDPDPPGVGADLSGQKLGDSVGDRDLQLSGAAEHAELVAVDGHPDCAGGEPAVEMVTVYLG